MKYMAVVGINYTPQGRGPEVRIEPGEDVPAALVKASPWLLDQGCVAEAAEAEPLEATPAGQVAAEAHLSGELTVTHADGEVE